MDKAQGDFDTAIKIFQEELNSLRSYCLINTIAMHGNPLSRFDNRDLWKKYDFKKYGILGESYKSINFNEFTYFSDSGRSWDTKYKVHDTIVQDGPRMVIRSTDELIGLIKRDDINRLYILAHPILWTRNMPVWYREFFRQNIFKVGKLIIKKTRA